jgi:hypothetical protein
VSRPTAIIVSVPTPSPGVVSAAGTCFSQDSTASVLQPGSRFASSLPLSKLEEGHRVLAVDANNKKIYAKVMAVHRSPASEPYLHIRVRLDSKHHSYTKTAAHEDHAARSATKHLRVTGHHTFPVCHEPNQLPALALKVGDCLHTSGGRGKVESISMSPITKKDVTYTVVLQGHIDMIAIGGVFTRAKPEHAAPRMSMLHGSKAHHSEEPQKNS